MCAAKLDAIIFGATGFTGKFVVEDAPEVLKGLQWGIAGRNEAKLRDVLMVVGKKIGQDLSHIPIIVADVNNEPSIQNMANRCRIVINCCGPYHLYGEVVVRACVEAGTHHVDITAEPQYINNMLLKYHHLAQQNGVYVVPACALESVPAEVGVLYAQRHFPGTINSIEVFVEAKINRIDASSRALMNTGTWDSMVRLMQNIFQLLRSERRLNTEKLPSLRPRLWLKPWISRTEGSDSYFLPFIMTDRFVVKRSQRLFYAQEKKRPIQFEMYLGFDTILWALLFLIGELFGVILAQFPCTRYLLLKYPRFFTLGLMSERGPVEVNRKSLELFVKMKARGWTQGTPESLPPNKDLIVQLSSTDGYRLTSKIVLICANIILQEHKSMPGTGGVLTPGFAFARTNIIEDLLKANENVKLEILLPNK